MTTRKREGYTNRQRRNNMLREMCHKLVRERMPEAYAILRTKAEQKYRKGGS